MALFVGAAACTAKLEGDSGWTPSAGAQGGMGGSGAGTAGLGSAGGAGAPGTGGSGASGGAPPGAGASATDPNTAGPMALRHLTSREYRNTVQSLVGDRSLAEDDVPNETSDPTFEYFPFRRPGMVGVVEAETLQVAAEAVAKNVAANVAAFLPCRPATEADEATCARTFIETFGRKAYRRPLTAGEITRLEALYGAGRTMLTLDFSGAIALLVEALLQSPALYYLDARGSGPTELDPNGNVAKLDGYALASRLSYFLWGSPPDDALLASAADGSLATADGVETAARRLATDDRAKEMAADFTDDLLDLDILLGRGKDTNVYPSFGLPLVEAMREEIRRYTTAVVLGASPTFETLLTSTSTFVNAPLAELYGIAGVGDGFSAATLPAAERGGLLTLAGFLANTGAAAGSVPPRRGKFVYTRMLCTEMPPPPNEIPAVTPPMPGLTTRARFEVHDQNPCAAGCHSILDGLGFAFEHYDGIGAYRATEQDAAVDSSSAYAFDEVNPVAFADAIDLGRVLAAQPLAQGCFVKQWLRYALRRQEVDADTSSLDGAVSAFRAHDGNIPELWVALATSRTFRYRAPAPDEVLP